MAKDLSESKNFKYTIEQEFGGYVSSLDKTKSAPNLMVSGSKNVYKKKNGNLAIREGQKRLGVANSTLSGISSEFVWDTSWGSTFTLVVSNSNLYVVSDNVWYSIQSSLTKTRYVFDKWWDNTLKKDDCLFVNGTSNLYKWGGGFGLLASTTATTIVLDRTVAIAHLPLTSGSVVVNGTTYAYTGVSGSTLTGVTPDPTAQAVNSGVLETVTTTSNKPDSTMNNDFIKVVNNQLYVGSYTSRFCYISSNTDYTNFTIPTPRLIGSPELIVLDANGVGIGVRQGNACLGYGKNGWAIISFSDVTVGTTLTNVTTKTLKPVALLQAPLAHEFIDSVGDNLVYLGQDNQVHSFGDFNNLFVAGYPSLSQEVATELAAENFTNGCLKCIGEFIYVVAPNSGKVYLRQERTRLNEGGQVVSEKLWHSPFVWGITRIDSANDLIIGFSSSNPQIYQLWDTEQYYDDSPSDEPLPYQGVVAFSYFGRERRQGLWSFGGVFTEGYITPNTPLMLTVNYNYNGASGIQTRYVNSLTRPAKFFSTSSSSLGDSSLGSESLGGSGDLEVSTNFKNINQFSLVNCFMWQLVYSSEEVNSNWEISAIGTNATVESEQDATFIINKQ